MQIKEQLARGGKNESFHTFQKVTDFTLLEITLVFRTSNIDLAVCVKLIIASPELFTLRLYSPCGYVVRYFAKKIPVNSLKSMFKS